MNLKIENSLKICRIVWFAMLLSMGMYYSVGQTMLNPAKPPSLDNNIFLILLLPAIFTFVLGFLLPNIIIKNYLRRDIAKPTEMGTAMAFQVGSIVRYALFEATAFLGMVVTSTSSDQKAQIAMTVVAAIGLLISFPRTEAWDAILEEVRLEVPQKPIA